MKKLSQSQKGFSAVETVLLVVVILLVTGVGLYVFNQSQKQDETTKPQGTGSGTVQRSQYKKTTQVPNGWKTYSNDKYKFQFSYPGDWELSEGDGDLGNTSSAKDSSIVMAYLTPPGHQGAQYELIVSNRSLDQAVADQKKIIVANGSGDDAFVGRILETKYYTYDGHDAVLLSYELKDRGAKERTRFDTLYVFANGQTYEMSMNADDNSDTVLTKKILTVSESFKVIE